MKSYSKGLLKESYEKRLCDIMNADPDVEVYDVSNVLQAFAKEKYLDGCTVKNIAAYLYYLRLHFYPRARKVTESKVQGWPDKWEKQGEGRGSKLSRKPDIEVCYKNSLQSLMATFRTCHPRR